MKSQKKKRGRPPKKSSLPSQASNTISTSAPSTSVPVPTASTPLVLTRQQKHRLLVQKVLQANPSLVLAASPPPVESLSGADHLIASTVPSSFPPDLVFRALSSYATLRTLSTQLKISPFTPKRSCVLWHSRYPQNCLAKYTRSFYTCCMSSVDLACIQLAVMGSKLPTIVEIAMESDA